jgi:hypothetical protein
VQFVLQKSLISRLIHDEQDPLQWRAVKQLLQLPEASLITWREAAEVHQHDVAISSQATHGHLPGILTTEELVDPLAAIGIGVQVPLAQALTHIRLALDELA